MKLVIGTTARSVLAEAMAAQVGYSGEDIPAWYMGEADEIIERLEGMGFIIVKGENG